jgi:hypothetical protein
VLAEGQRAAAIASYAASSATLGSASGRTQILRGGIRFAPSSRDSAQEANRRQAAAARAESFFAVSADKIDQAIAFASAQAPDRLGAQAESAKAQIAASIETKKNAISGAIEKARGQARREAAAAQLAVASQAASFVAGVESGTEGAIEALTATHTTALAQVGELETSTLEGVNQIYADGRARLEGLGATVGGECTAAGEQFAQTYEGFANCTENGFWDGDLSERRAHAQAEAARKTAKGYHDRIIESGKKRAREITKNGRKQNRCAVIASARHGREALDQQLANLTTALQTARDAAILQAGNTRDTLLASIETGLTATLRQLDQTEHDQRQAADDTGYMQQVMQEQLAHAGSAALQRAVADASTALQTTLFDLQSRFGSSNPPDPNALDQALTAVTQRIDSAMSGLQFSIDGGAGALEQQLAGAAGAGLAALDAVVTSSDEMVGTLSAGFSSSINAIAGTDNFAAQRQGFTQLVQQATAGGTAALAQAVGGMRQGCDAITADSRKSLDQASVDLEANLRQSKQGLECDITQHADEAASHEAPAWKMLVAILLVIIVIVIIIAVTILTAGMALGPLAMIGAGILIGAAVGAVTSGLLAIAGNLWSNQRWSVGVGHAVLVGAITGAVGGGIGAGAGLAFKGAAVAVQYGAAMVTAGLLDAGGQFVAGGFSFKAFSWTSLGITLVVTALTLGLAHGVGGPKPTGAGAAGEGARPTVEPVAAPHEPVPVPTEPVGVPTEPVAASAEPAARPSEPTSAPAEPAAQRTEPTARAAEPTAEPTPAPREPAAQPTEPTGRATAPTAEPTGRPGEPTQPGAPEGAPAEPGRAATTPEEKTLLESTASKSGEELTPAEATTEREIAGRTEGEPIEDPPFTSEHELPNGHKIKETPEGEIFERCSPGCGRYDSEGNLVGEPEAGITPEEQTARDISEMSDEELEAEIRKNPKKPGDNYADELRFERYRRGGGEKGFEEWLGVSRGGRPGGPAHQADVAANNGPPNNLRPQAVGNTVPDGVGLPGQAVEIRGQTIAPEGNGRVLVESDEFVWDGEHLSSEARAQVRAMREGGPNDTIVVTDQHNPESSRLVIFKPGEQPPPPGTIPRSTPPIEKIK